jgi:hypothetical protein
MYELPESLKSHSLEMERRDGGRHCFTASAEVVDLSSGARFSARTSDLGQGGCYVDSLVPFPTGSKVHVKISCGKNKLESSGIVVYSHYGLGMGVAFDPLEAVQKESLDHWIAEATGERPANHTDAARSLNSAHIMSRDEHAMLTRLVQLLIGKRILTAAEGDSVLQDVVM